MSNITVGHSDCDNHVTDHMVQDPDRMADHR